MGIVFDTSKDGFQTVMKDYQEMALRFSWEKREEGVTSGVVWIHVNKVLREKERSISRASIIFFLNAMCEEGVLDYREETGKGGYHKIYFPKMDEEEFKRHVVKTVMSKLSEIWPDATRKALGTSRELGS